MLDKNCNNGHRVASFVASMLQEAVALVARVHQLFLVLAGFGKKKLKQYFVVAINSVPYCIGRDCRIKVEKNAANVNCTNRFGTGVLKP